MRSLKIQIEQIDAARLVDSLEIAISVITAQLHDEIDFGTSEYTASQLRNAIEDFQILRADTMLASRNAAKEAAPKSDDSPRGIDNSRGNYAGYDTDRPW